MKGDVSTIKADLKDLLKKVDNKFDRFDNKFDRIDNKIDRLVYFFLGGIVLKGGFDFYMKERALKENRITEKEK